MPRPSSPPGAKASTRCPSHSHQTANTRNSPNPRQRRKIPNKDPNHTRRRPGPPPQLTPQQDDPTRHAQEPSTPPKTRTRTGPPIPRQKPITQHIRTQNAPERCTRTKHMTPQAAPAPNPAAQSPESSTAPNTNPQHQARQTMPGQARTPRDTDTAPPCKTARHHHANTRVVPRIQRRTRTRFTIRTNRASPQKTSTTHATANRSTPQAPQGSHQARPAKHPPNGDEPHNTKPNSKPTKHPSAKTPGRRNTQAPKHPSAKTPERQTPEHRNIRAPNIRGNAQTTKAWRRTESNRRPPACKAGALPIELRPHGSQHPIPRPPRYLRHQTPKHPAPSTQAPHQTMGQGGFEPPTPRLSSVCSNQLSY